ncbi:MAG: MaoC family dehydratase [Rhodovibrio sp.]|nr:MaoC family dehydratase [Rhodovibrio sp.]
MQDTQERPVTQTPAGKQIEGNYFEDFRLGQELRHATPRTVTEGDQALYLSLTGARFALNSSAAAAREIGYDGLPLDDWLAFHLVFGKSVPDISLNAVANLGYAEGVFRQPVYPGDTISTVSEVIGLKQNSNGKTGTVYVRSRGAKADGTSVLDYVRWVMVHKRDPESPAPDPHVPDLAEAVPAEQLELPANTDFRKFDTGLTGQPHLFEDFAVGEKIDHVDGMTIEEAEHQMATRLYQNTARVHFNQHQQSQGRFARRIVYGGHVISIARALTFNGLGNAIKVAAINAGRHTKPCFAGDTVYAWSQVLDCMEIPGRPDVGALRLRTIATKDRSCADHPLSGEDGKYDPAVILDLDYTVLIPRRG